MVRKPLRAALLGAALLSAALAAADARPVRLSIQTYRAELQRWERDLGELESRPQNAPQLSNSIPESWIVAASGTTLEVSAAFLRDALTEFRKAPPARQPALLERLRSRLRMMSEEAAAFEQPARVDAAVRARLQEILATREFRGARGPTLLEMWRDRIIAWVDRLLWRMASRVPSPFGLGRLFVWCVIAVSASVLALWLYRVSRRQPVKAAAAIIPFAPSATNWQVWLKEAREQADQGRWREAIHLAYWAAVSHLEASGMWFPDRARTPREYVRAIPRTHPAQAVLDALTRRLEAAWYGCRSVSATEFNEVLTQLEQLGCR